MLKIILSFLLLPTLVFAQNQEKQKEKTKKPYVDDVYESNSIAVIDSVSLGRWFFTDFEPGEVIFANGTSKKGFIKFNGQVLFKDSLNGKRTKYLEKDLKSFSVGEDVYVVAKNFKFQYHRMWGDTKDDIGYLKRSIEGKASLYFNVVRSASGNPSPYSYTNNTNCYLKFEGSENYSLIPLNKKKFATMANEIFDDEASLNIINDAKFKPTVEVLKQLVIAYNSR